MKARLEKVRSREGGMGEGRQPPPTHTHTHARTYTHTETETVMVKYIDRQVGRYINGRMEK